MNRCADSIDPSISFQTSQEKKKKKITRTLSPLKLLFFPLSSSSFLRSSITLLLLPAVQNRLRERRGHREARD